MLLDNLKLLIVPKIDELTVQNIIEFVKKHFDLLNYLPESNKGIIPNREWIWNIGNIWHFYYWIIVNTLINDKLSKFVSDKTAEREKCLYWGEILGLIFFLILWACSRNQSMYLVCKWLNFFHRSERKVVFCCKISSKKS